MYKIREYNILGKIKDEITIETPYIHKWLFIQNEHNILKICVVAGTKSMNRETIILIRTIGQEFTGEEGEYIGTFKKDKFIFYAFASNKNI